MVFAPCSFIPVMVGSGCGRVSMPMAMVPTSKCVPVPAVNAAVGAIDATCSMYKEHSGTTVLTDSYLSIALGYGCGVSATTDPVRGHGLPLRCVVGPGACQRFSGCALSPYSRRGTAARSSHDSRGPG